MGNIYIYIYMYILYWLNVNFYRFLLLSLVARHVFTIPVSTVASKSVFSMIDHVLDFFSITHCLLRWLRQGFQIRTKPYGPIGKTVNLSQSRFFNFKNRSMPKKQETVRTVVQLHGSENRDPTTSHGSLLIWT